MEFLFLTSTAMTKADFYKNKSVIETEWWLNVESLPDLVWASPCAQLRVRGRAAPDRMERCLMNMKSTPRSRSWGISEMAPALADQSGRTCLAESLETRSSPCGIMGAARWSRTSVSSRRQTRYGTAAMRHGQGRWANLNCRRQDNGRTCIRDGGRGTRAARVTRSVQATDFARSCSEWRCRCQILTGPRKAKRPPRHQLSSLDPKDCGQGDTSGRDLGHRHHVPEGGRAAVLLRGLHRRVLRLHRAHHELVSGIDGATLSLAAQKALETLPRDGDGELAAKPKIRSDNGSGYSSREFHGLLEHHGLTHHKITPHCLYRIVAANPTEYAS